MPWKPPTDEVDPNPSLDGFREAAAEVVDGGQVIATLVFDVEPIWTLMGGHLWWRRWSRGVEVVYGYWMSASANGEQTDWVSDPRDPVSQTFLTELLSGRYVQRNYDVAEAPIARAHEVRWLDQPKRSQARRRCGFS